MSPMNFTIQFGGRLVFGVGTLSVLPREAARWSDRAFVVTTRDLTALGLTERVRRLLAEAGMAAAFFEDVRPDPTCVDIDRASALAREAGAGTIIAVGGGSSIDLAKAVAVGARHEGPIWDYVTYTGARARPLSPQLILPVIAVPTTAGTGSEVSIGSVMDNPEIPMKAALLDPLIQPRVAVIDPELTYTLPPGVTAMTGFDALTHGIESFLNVERTNPGSELFALEAVRRVAVNLSRVLADGGDHRARAEMCWAATCGGMAIGLSNASVAHAMALPLGARTGIPHGLALARLQPVVLRRTWEVQPERCAVLAEAAGAARAGAGAPENARALAIWVEDFVGLIGLRQPWAGPGIDDALLDALATDVLSYMGRPVSQYRPVFTRTEIRSMFEEALRPGQE